MGSENQNSGFDLSLYCSWSHLLSSEILCKTFYHVGQGRFGIVHWGPWKICCLLLWVLWQTDWVGIKESWDDLKKWWSYCIHRQLIIASPVCARSRRITGNPCKTLHKMHSIKYSFFICSYSPSGIDMCLRQILVLVEKEPCGLWLFQPLGSYLGFPYQIAHTELKLSETDLRYVLNFFGFLSVLPIKWTTLIVTDTLP